MALCVENRTTQFVTCVTEHVHPDLTQKQANAQRVLVRDMNSKTAVVVCDGSVDPALMDAVFCICFTPGQVEASVAAGSIPVLLGLTESQLHHPHNLWAHTAVVVSTEDTRSIPSVLSSLAEDSILQRRLNCLRIHNTINTPAVCRPNSGEQKGKQSPTRRPLYTSTRGLADMCTVVPDPMVSSTTSCGVDVKRVKHRMIIDREDGVLTSVFVCSSALRDFITTVVPGLGETDRIVLVTGDSDLTVPHDVFKNPGEFKDFVGRPQITHWFCQNWVGTHEKVTGYPIGLNYHTLAEPGTSFWWGAAASIHTQDSQVAALVEVGRPFWERKREVYCNFQHSFLRSRFGYDRMEACEALAAVPGVAFFQEDRLIRSEALAEMQTFAFVASPSGNGLDCYRTWEALVLGCIVVVKRGPLDYLYEDLPVLVVDRWSEVSSDVLDATVTAMRQRFEGGDLEIPMKRLLEKHWSEKMLQKTVISIE